MKLNLVSASKLLRRQQSVGMQMFVNGLTDGSVLCQHRAWTQWASSWPSGPGSTLMPLGKAWGLEVSNQNDLLAPLASLFLGFILYSETRHWINCVDYEGPPCSVRIIKKGYPGGELCNNFARKCVWVRLGSRVGWARPSPERREGAGERLISSMMDEPISCPVLAQV